MRGMLKLVIATAALLIVSTTCFAAQVWVNREQDCPDFTRNINVRGDWIILDVDNDRYTDVGGECRFLSKQVTEAGNMLIFDLMLSCKMFANNENVQVPMRLQAVPKYDQMIGFGKWIAIYKRCPFPSPSRF